MRSPGHLESPYAGRFACFLYGVAAAALVTWFIVTARYGMAPSDVELLRTERDACGRYRDELFQEKQDCERDLAQCRLGGGR